MSKSTLTIEARADLGDTPYEGPTPARVWGDQWLRVSEKVLKGLNHKLTNRVAGLEAVVSVFEPEDHADPELVRALSAEVMRLHELLELYRLMPAEPFANPEPCRLQDVIPQMLKLHLHHSDLKEIPCELEYDANAQPILVRQSALLRCLLVLLESGAGNALRSGVNEPLRLRYSQRGQHVIIEFEAPAPSGQLLFSGEGSLLHAVRSALGHAHGVVDAAATRADGYDIIRYELCLPTLSEARRMEKSRAG